MKGVTSKRVFSTVIKKAMDRSKKAVNQCTISRSISSGSITWRNGAKTQWWLRLDIA